MRTERQMVNHPEHYGGDTIYEVIKVLEAWDLGFHLGNTVKYVARAGKKPGTDELEDLEKALWYLRRRISMLKGDTNSEIALLHLDGRYEFVPDDGTRQTALIKVDVGELLLEGGEQ